MITVETSGSFDHTDRFLNRLLRRDPMSILDKYGQIGVNALAAATPIESGETAASWYYTTEKSATSYTLTWRNSHIDDGRPIAILLQYGHATGTGGYVQGRDYINPAIRPIFDQIATDVWREVTSA